MPGCNAGVRRRSESRARRPWPLSVAAAGVRLAARRGGQRGPCPPRPSPRRADPPRTTRRGRCALRLRPQWRANGPRPGHRGGRIRRGRGKGPAPSKHESLSSESVGPSRPRLSEWARSSALAPRRRRRLEEGGCDRDRGRRTRRRGSSDEGSDRRRCMAGYLFGTPRDGGDWSPRLRPCGGAGGLPPRSGSISAPRSGGPGLTWARRGGSRGTRGRPVESEILREGCASELTGQRNAKLQTLVSVE